MKGMIIFIAVSLSFIFMRQNAASAEPVEGTVKSIVLPSIEVSLKEGAGKDKTAAFCNICHSADYITMQPQFSPDTWSAIVHKMVVVYGAPVSEDDSRTIINYLSSNYGAATPPASSEMKMKEQPAKELPTGEELFMKHCAVCHPGGGNIINPKKTLHREDLEKSGIKTPEDIIKLMRNPGRGMSTFDNHTVPDKEARRIAEYILKTF